MTGAFSESGVLHTAIRIRPAGEYDIPAMLGIEKSQASAAHWTEAAYVSMFAPDTLARIILVAEDTEHRIAGFVIGRVAAGECELENIAVLPAQSRQGIGSALLRAFIHTARLQGARGISLEVRESNTAARLLYEKCDFRMAGGRQRYYSNPVEDAVLYSLKLLP